MDQEQKPHGRSLIRELVPDRRPTRQQKLWAIRITIVLVVVLGLLTLIGLPFGISLWNWLDLLIIPVVLAIGGFLFTRSENRATQEAAERRAQDDTLQAYLDQIGQLLLDPDRPLRQSKEDDEVRTLARARTLTVLPRLDGDRKRSVLQFLYESGLISKDRAVLVLSGAYLSRAYLSWANLSRADLSWAYLSGADLSRADLGWANLSGANLSGANLSEATKWTEMQLTTARSLKGATMPDGQRLKSGGNPDGPTFEEWLESRQNKKDQEDSGPS